MIISEQISQQFSYLPDYLGGHLLLTISALLIGISISFPLALSILQSKKLQWVTLAFASVMQTIPGIALLALMVPLLSMIGFVPALIALVLYSMLPILRNTITGIANVDPALKEAALGIGMSYKQRLFKVELPLALPVIVAGIRTSAVWVVGTATLSTPVGATSLGNYIFSGLHTQNYTAVMFGCVAAALLAISLDQLIKIIETAIVNKSKPLLLTSLTAIIVIFALGLAPIISKSFANEKPKVIIGSKLFTEQYILGEVLAGYFNDAGYAAELKPGMGSTILFEALKENQIHCYIDYSGTVWTNYMKKKTSGTRQVVLEKMREWLKNEHGILALGSLGFENKYALAMKKENAKRLKIESISDLSGQSAKMVLGSDYDFINRPEWEDIKREYNLKFQSQRTFDPALMYSAVNENKVDVIPAYSTDGRIIDYELILLDDPKNIFPPYDAVILISPSASDNRELVELLRNLDGKISDKIMREANNSVDLKGVSVSRAANILMKKIR